MDYQSLYNLYFQDQTKQKRILQERISSESTTNFDFFISKNPAFLYLHPDHYALMIEIQRLDKELFSVLSVLPKIALTHYIKNTLVSEIKNTNDIEGVITTRKEIVEILDQLSLRKHDRLYGMVKRYSFLMDLRQFALDIPNDIRVLYDELVKEEIRQADQADILDGALFRKDTVYLYKASGKILHEGLTPETEIIAYLGKALLILKDKNLDILIRISLFHYLFGYIHPFYNGNGRVNRFISSYLLSQSFTPLIGYQFSLQVKNQKKLYYDAFEKTNDPRNKGDLGTFVIAFLKLIRDSFLSTINALKERSQQLDHYLELIGKSDFSPKQKELLFILTQSSLFADEGVKIEELVEYSGQSTAWIRKKMTMLENKGLLMKNRNGHFWKYQANLKALDELTLIEKSNKE